jgi:hypothetical protein
MLHFQVMHARRFSATLRAVDRVATDAPRRGRIVGFGLLAGPEFVAGLHDAGSDAQRIFFGPAFADRAGARIALQAVKPALADRHGRFY